MPNWCANSLKVSHSDPAKITALAAAFAEGRFCTAVIPVPQDLRDTVSGSMGEDQREAHEAQQKANVEKYGYANWYDFCVARWGTKWDVGGADASIEIADTGLSFHASFESAWAPPLGVFEELRAQGCEVVGYYWECSMGFVGRWHNGDDLCYDYSGLNSETVRGYIGDELDDYFGISESLRESEQTEDCFGSPSP